MTKTNPQILSLISQRFFFTSVKSLKKNKIGCINILNNHFLLGKTFPSVVQKAISPNSNFLDASKFI